MDEASTRARVARQIRVDPGLSTRAVASSLSLDESTADYHLRRLRRAGDIVADRAGRELAWFVNGSGFCPLLRVALPAFRRPTVVALARALDEMSRTAGDLAERADIAVGEVRWAAELLSQAGVVERSGTGRLSLAPGAEVCVRQALSREACPRWGACEPSQRMRSLEAATGENA